LLSLENNWICPAGWLGSGGVSAPISRTPEK